MQIAILLIFLNADNIIKHLFFVLFKWHVNEQNSFISLSIYQQTAFVHKLGVIIVYHGKIWTLYEARPHTLFVLVLVCCLMQEI